MNEKMGTLSVDEIIGSLQNLNNSDRARLQNALFELQCDLDLKEAIEQGLDDKRNGRVTSHQAVMKEIREKHNVL